MSGPAASCPGPTSAGAPETRRISARVYGDGSIPFALTGGKDTFRLVWSNGKGSIEGVTSYDIYEWKAFG